METTIFNLDNISANQAFEMSRWLNSMPGVDDVSVDIGGQVVTITYDPARTDRGTIKSDMLNQGYLIN